MTYFFLHVSHLSTSPSINLGNGIYLTKFQFFSKDLTVQNKHLLLEYSLEKVSLARGSLGHFPPWREGYVIGNLIGRLTEMLRGGSCWGHARQGATGNSSQLQGGWGWVSSDVMGCECSPAPSIGTGLCWKWSKTFRFSIICIIWKEAAINQNFLFFFSVDLEFYSLIKHLFFFYFLQE